MQKSRVGRARIQSGGAFQMNNESVFQEVAGRNVNDIPPISNSTLRSAVSVSYIVSVRGQGWILMGMKTRRYVNVMCT